MGNGPEIATAYVSLVPTMAGASSAIATELGGPAATGAAAKAGAKSGKAWGARFAAAGKIATAGLTLPILAIGGAAIAAGVKVDKAYDVIRQGTGATGKDLEGLKNSFRNVASSTPADIERVSATIADLNTTLGYTGPNLETVATQVLEVGRMAGVDVDIQAVSATLSGFGTKAKDAAGEMDSLFQISQATGVPFNDLTKKLSTQGGVLKSLGFGLEDSASLIGVLSKAGVNSTTVVRSLGAGLIKLTEDGEAPQEAFRRVSGEIDAFVKSGDEASALQLAGKVFGTRGAPQFVAALKTGKINLEDMASAAGLSGDSILGVAEETKSFPQLWQEFKNSATLALAPIGAKLMPAISDALTAAAPYLQKFADWFSGLSEGQLKVLLGVAAALAAIGPALWIASGALKVWNIATKIAAAFQWAWNAAFAASGIGTIIVLIAALVAGLVWFFTKTKVGQKIVKAAWGAIQGAVKAVVDWWTKTALPAIKRFFGGISRVVGKVVDWVKKNWPLLLGIITGPIGLAVLFVIKNWGKIKGAFKAVWDWTKKNVFDKIAGFFSKGGPLRTTFSNVVTAIGTIFSGVQGKLRAVWDWVKENVFGKITGFLGKGGPLRTAFSKAKDAIGTIWDGLKKLAATPINFVLETVYNNGIRAFVGDVFEFFKKPNPLPKATPVAFAQGSEDHRAQIARGGAMRLWAEPETGGEAYIPLAASKRTRSTAILSKVAATFGYGLTQYAGGGFFGEAADFLRGPIDYVKTKAGAVIADKFGNRSGGMWDLLKEVPRMLVGPLATYAKNKLASIFGSDTPGGAKYDGKAAGAFGWQRQWDIVKKAFPTAQLTSAYRPGAVTAVGTPSYHGMGRAIDITPSMQIFDWLAKSFPGATELIFSPANNRQLYKGRPTLFGEPTRGDHWDHIHWAMAHGGILPGVFDRGGWLPAGGVGVNLTGRPEAVLSPAESTGLKAMLANPGRTAEYHFHTTRVTPRDVVQAERLHELRSWAGAGA